MNTAYRVTATDRRLGLLLTFVVHVALLIGWQAARRLPAPAAAVDGRRSTVLWIPLPLPRPRPAQGPAPRDQAPAPPRKEASAPHTPQRSSTLTLPPLRQAAPAPTPAPAPAPQPMTAPADGAAALSQSTAPKPSAEQILQQARRDIGGIDKALRKENKPYIAAPLDSPQIRLRRGIEQAAAMAPNRLWEAPKVDDLVNDTGDGARRSRVITGNGTYCITDRAPTTSIDMIEKHGKQRFTNCPQHEQPATQQEWRTLRD